MRRVADRVPPIRRLREQRARQALEVEALKGPLSGAHEVVGSVRLAFPLGHFYSPIPNLDEVKAREAEIFACPPELPGITIDADLMLARLAEFEAYYAERPYPDAGAADGLRYRFDNGFFEYGDGVAYYCMLRSIRPKTIIEIGSGWSSALALDVDERFLGGSTRLVFIEPYPDRLESLLTASDRERIEIHRQPLHAVDRTVWTSLVPGDILFVDSTHVSKVGSDVNQIVLDIFPRLPAGVHVHVHDIGYPFEYPANWIYGGRAWNESYLLRAFLVNNTRAKITWFNNYLARFHADRVTRSLPLWARNPGGSLWFEVVAA